MIITIINFALFALPLILGCRREGVISIDFVLFTPRNQRLEDNGEGGWVSSSRVSFHRPQHVA